MCHKATTAAGRSIRSTVNLEPRRLRSNADGPFFILLRAHWVCLLCIHIYIYIYNIFDVIDAISIQHDASQPWVQPAQFCLSFSLSLSGRTCSCRATAGSEMRPFPR